MKPQRAYRRHSAQPTTRAAVAIQADRWARACATAVVKERYS